MGEFYIVIWPSNILYTSCGASKSGSWDAAEGLTVSRGQDHVQPFFPIAMPIVFGVLLIIFWTIGLGPPNDFRRGTISTRSVRDGSAFDNYLGHCLGQSFLAFGDERPQFLVNRDI